MCRNVSSSGCNPVVEGVSFDLCGDCPAEAPGSASCVPTRQQCQRGCVIYREGNSEALFNAVVSVAQAAFSYYQEDPTQRNTGSLIQEILRIVFDFMRAQREEQDNQTTSSP